MDTAECCPHAAALQRLEENDAEEMDTAVEEIWRRRPPTGLAALPPSGVVSAEIAADEMAFSICLLCFVYLHVCFVLFNDEGKKEEGMMTTIKRKKRETINKRK